MRPLTNFDPSDLPLYQKAIDTWEEDEFRIGLANDFGGMASPRKGAYCLYLISKPRDLGQFWKHFDKLTPEFNGIHSQIVKLLN